MPVVKSRGITENILLNLSRNCLYVEIFAVEPEVRKTAIAIGLGALAIPTLGVPLLKAIQASYDRDGHQFIGSSLVESPEVRSSPLARRVLVTEDGKYTVESRPSVVTSFAASYTVSPDGTYVLFSQLFPKHDPLSKERGDLKFGLKFTTWNTNTGKTVESKFSQGDEPTLTSKNDSDFLKFTEKHRVLDFSILGQDSSRYALISLRAVDFSESIKNNKQDGLMFGYRPVVLWGISLQSGSLFRLGGASEGDYIIGSPYGESGFIFSVQRREGGSGEGAKPVTVVSYFSMQQGVSKAPSVLNGLIVPKGWNDEGNLICYHQEASGPEGWVTIRPSSGEQKISDDPKRPEFNPPVRFESSLKVTGRGGRFYLEPKDKDPQDLSPETSLELPTDVKGGEYIPQRGSNHGLLMLVKEDGTVVSYRVRKE